MSEFVEYTPKTWASREFIKRTDMNHLEKGVKDNNIMIKDLIDTTALKTDIEHLQDQVDAIRTIGSNIKVYGVKFDKVNNTCTRLWDAADITTDTSAFRYTSPTSTVSNPFDKLYPWSEFEVCNVDLAAYKALTADDDLRDCVTAWYDDPDFVDDNPTKFVGRYRPEYWYTGYEDDGVQIYAIATGEIEGWGFSPACIDSYAFVNDDGSNPTGTDGTGTLTCYRGGQPLVNVSMQNIHTRAKNTGFTLENIYIQSAIATAFVVEYANTNSQTALGEGCDAAYRASNEHPLVAGTQVTTVVLPKACQAFAIEGATIDFAASNDGVSYADRRMCKGNTAYEANSNYINVLLDKPVTFTTSTFVSFHGAVNTAVPPGNHSGYIGVAGKQDAFYRGAVMYANRWSYVLGCYRQTGTQHIWVCPDIYDCDKYDALDTSKHVDTGYTLSSTNGYVKELFTGGEFGLGIVPWCKSVGGNTAAPVGDYFYTNASAGNTILIVGGSAYSGLNAGCFYGLWTSAAEWDDWDLGGRAGLLSKKAASN